MAETLEFELKAITTNFQKAINNAKKGAQSLEKSFSKVATTSAAAFTGLTAAIGATVNEAAKIETITSQFEVLTGSVLGAQKAVADLQDFAATTPFSFESVANAGRQLLAFGFEVDQIKPKLQELGDVAAASGADVGELTTIYGQVAAAGKLTGERLLQLQERAIPIGPALAKTLGVTESAVRGLVSSGKVGFKEFEQAFASLNQQGGFAFGGLEKVSGTLDGKISTLKDNFSLLASEFGKQFLPAAKQAADALIQLFTTLRENPELIKTAARFARIALGATAVATAVGIAGVIFAKLAAAALTVGGVVVGLLNPFTLLATAIGGIVLVVGDLLGFWDASFQNLEKIARGFIERIKTLFSGLGNLLNAAFSLDTDGIKSALNEIEAAFLNSTDAMEARKAEIEAERRERNERELAEEKEKQAQLEQQEIEAQNARAVRREEERQQQLEEEQAELQRKLEANEEIDEILSEQRLELNEKERSQLQEFLAQKEGDKLASIKKELDARRKQRKEDEKIEREYGKTFLTLQKAVNSESFKNAENLAAQNVNLARSSNNTISSIGKAAAITQIITDSAKGAMAVFAQSVATFPPPIGPAIGATLAAAQIAFGLERVGQVRAAQQGGLVEGTGIGDSVPFLLEPGELVVPRRNFDEVVADAAVRADAEDEAGEPGAAGTQNVEVVVGFTDDAFEIIEQKILERRDSGVGVI